MITSSQTETVPDLEPYCGSWIVVSRETGGAVFETYNRKTAEEVNQEKYEVLTAYQWLVRLNQTAREQAEGSAAATLGRKGGKARSDKKTDASRENGKRGGRPRKNP